MRKNTEPASPLALSSNSNVTMEMAPITMRIVAIPPVTAAVIWRAHVELHATIYSAIWCLLQGVCSCLAGATMLVACSFTLLATHPTALVAAASVALGAYIVGDD